MNEVLIIVDYDNCFSSEIDDTTSVLKILVDKIITGINPSERFVQGNVRLYGGWYEKDHLTKNAQRINSSLSSLLNGEVNNANCCVEYCLSVNLATSLLSKPTNDFFATFRPKGNLKKIARISDLAKNCKILSNRMPNFKDLLERGTCVVQDCPTPCDDLIVYKAQQKMVDTMITCDLLQSVNNQGYKYICLVSDDEDFIPALIATASNQRCKLYRFSLHKSYYQSINQLPNTIIQKEIQ